jgi:hypothetical protein
MFAGSGNAPERVAHRSCPRFFVPMEMGSNGEQVYQDLRRTVESEMGRPPSSRRIVELWTRRGNLDCVTVVGSPDPVTGAIVTAIFDMGPHRPFVVVHPHAADPARQSCSVLGCSAYSVSEFSA